MDGWTSLSSYPESSRNDIAVLDSSSKWVGGVLPGSVLGTVAVTPLVIVFLFPWEMQ